MRRALFRIQTDRRCLFLGAALAVFASCALAADNHPIEYLDEVTGATVTTVARPLIFIRTDARASANGAEYLTLAAARIDRSGKIQHLLVGYLWSVGGANPVGANADQLRIEAGENILTLQSAGHAASDLGVHQPIHPPPLGTAVPYFYLVNMATYHAIATSTKVSLQLPGITPRTYAIFEDHFRAFAEFVRTVSALDE